MSTKFKPGDEVYHNGKRLTVQVSTKNFTSNVVSYLLSDGNMVAEDKLKIASAVSEDTNAELLEKYQTLFGKKVPINKIRDLEWIQTKVTEKEAELEAEKQKGQDVIGTGYDVLAKLTDEEMAAFIKEKSLNINPEDYEDQDELLKAVCQEMSIEIPA